MQIDRGAPTGDLNPIRNHLDQLKGGRISTRLHPATAIHILAIDPWPPRPADAPQRLAPHPPRGFDLCAGGGHAA
jgi:hypothetical protein